MHPYLPHLLADIKSAERNEQPGDIPQSKSFEEEMEETEEWVAGIEQGHTFGYYCGLIAEDFPPAEQFSMKELELVCKAFQHMMFTWNQGISLPDRFPVYLAYKFLVNTLSKQTSIPQSGFMSFDFCTGNAPDCIFKEYCPCLEFWKDVQL